MSQLPANQGGGGVPPEDLTGTTVGNRFAIRARLGCGGMGEVYRADDTKLHCPVALKRVTPQLRTDQRFRQRLQKEAESAVKLRGEAHIAAIYDVLEQDGELFVVMEYVEGETLHDRMQRPLSIKEFQEIAVQCAEALVAAHKRGLVHRDIKPKNIMLTADGKVKILDFGVAKRLPDAQDTRTADTFDTAGTGVSGTPGYIAPEVLLREESDGRADIFSLGVVFYQMLTGRHPFRAGNLEVLQAMPLRVSLRNPRVPAELERIVTKMLAKRPEERYATARDLLVDLRRLPPMPVPRPRRREEEKEEKQQRWHVWVARLVAVALVALIAWLLWPVPPSQPVRVVVMPFENQTENRQMDELNRTLADALTADLANAPNVRVYPYSRLIEILSGIPPEEWTSHDTVRTVAAWSGSEFVVLPKMLAFGDNLRLQAELRHEAGEKSETIKVEKRLSGSPADTYYSMLGDLARKIDARFKDRGPGEDYEPPPPTSRPRNVTAARYLTEGKTALAQGKYAQALKAFEQAIREDPAYPLAYTWTARIYGFLGYDQRAREFSQRAVDRITPETPASDTYFIEATWAESTYEFSAAESNYEQLIAFNPGKAVWYFNLAKLYQAQSQYPKAIAWFQTVLQKDPKFIAAHQELATLYRRTGDFEQAESQAKTALHLYQKVRNREGEANVLLELSEIARLKGEYEAAQRYAEQGREVFRELDHDVGLSLAALRLGNLRWHQRKYDQAREHWRRVVSTGGQIRNNRNVVIALMNIGVSYEYEGDLARAVQHYREALSQEWPARWEQAQVKSNLAVLYIQYGVNPDEGLELAQEALATLRQVGDRGFQAQTHLVLSFYYKNIAWYPQAFDHIRQAQAIFRGLGQKERLAAAIRNAGWTHFVQNQYEEARQSFAQMLELAQELDDSYRAVDSRLSLGWVYQRLGDSARARTLLDQAWQTIQEERDRYQDLLPEAYAARGEFYWRNGERERARDSFQRAADWPTGIGLIQSSVEARSHLGRLQAEQGNLSRGLALCRGAVEQARQLKAVHVLATSLTDLAEIHLLRKEYGQALEALEEALAEENLGLEYRALALHARGRALEAQGNSDEAQAAYRQTRAAIRQLQQTLPPAHQENFITRPDIQALLP